MIQIERILYPTDFSALASHAARYASFLTNTSDASVHLLFVLDPHALVTENGGQARPEEFIEVCRDRLETTKQSTAVLTNI